MSAESELVLYVTVAISFGILHFFLWVFAPESKKNLLFSIYALIFSLVVFTDFRSSVAPAQSTQVFNVYLHLHRLLVPFLVISLLLLLLSTFNRKIPKWFWPFAIGFVLLCVWISFKPRVRYDYFYIILLFLDIEMGRILYLEYRNKKSGTWIIILGFVLFLIFPLYDLVTDMKIMPYIGQIKNGYPIGFLGLTACFSIYLARDFSLRNKRILREKSRANELEFQKRMVEESEKRKTEELEQARNLQLAMLPDNHNPDKHLDMAFRMFTATEVGGDYYDFRKDDDGIIIAIGDALGHGMRAGMLVTIVKSLFVAENDLSDFPRFFKKCSRVFHTMKLRKLFMGLQLTHFSPNRLKVATAGLPPLLIYRKQTQAVEKIVQKAMPLGGPVTFPYKQEEIDLKSGDVVIMMTDGLTERFNQQKNMLGQEKLCEWLVKYANEESKKILDSIITETNSWAGTEQRDDITLCVVKIN